MGSRADSFAGGNSTVGSSCSPQERCCCCRRRCGTSMPLLSSSSEGGSSGAARTWMMWVLLFRQMAPRPLCTTGQGVTAGQTAAVLWMRFQSRVVHLSPTHSPARWQGAAPPVPAPATVGPRWPPQMSPAANGVPQGGSWRSGEQTDLRTAIAHPLPAPPPRPLRSACRWR